MEILQAISDIGLLRDVNEDYAFCCCHPADETVKLLVLADGMGGKSQGDIASQEVVADMESWFYHESIDNLREINGIGEKLDKRIKKVNKYLIDKYGEDVLGTTLTLVVVGKNKSLVFNIGDSRCYVYKDKKLIQVSEDDSGVWVFYKDGDVSKDDLRFFPTNNFITACVGLNETLCKSKFYIIDNDYDMVLLLTDGVTDLLADNDIKKIIDRKKQVDILKEIIRVAVHKDLRLHVPMSLKRKFIGRFTVPIHGRDNASGVIYIKD